MHTIARRATEVPTLRRRLTRHVFKSVLTAKTHVSRAMTKAGSRDRAQLVVYAYQSGML